MFYKEEDVLLFLNCPRCKNRYTDARILPCSETICVNCIETLNVNGEFTCPFCKKKHNGDFVQNKLIMSMLKIRSDNVIRDPLVEELKQKTTQLESLMEQLEKSIKSLEIEVYEHCSLIRNQIDLAAEKRKVQIDEIRFKFLTQVDDYEKQCVQNLKEYKIDGRYKEFEKSLKMHIDECREMLKNFRIDEAQVNKETEVTTSKIKEIEAFLIELKHVQFKGEVLKFTEQTFTFTDQDDRILGCINRKKITENSIHHPTPFLAFAQQPGAPPAGLPTTLSNQQATGPAAALAVLTKLQFAAVTAAQRQRPVDTYMQHQQQQQQQQQSQALPNPNQHQHHSNQSNQPHPQPQNNPMHHPAHRPPYSHMPDDEFNFDRMLPISSELDKERRDSPGDSNTAKSERRDSQVWARIMEDESLTVRSKISVDDDDDDVLNIENPSTQRNKAPTDNKDDDDDDTDAILAAYNGRVHQRRQERVNANRPSVAMEKHRDSSSSMRTPEHDNINAILVARSKKVRPRQALRSYFFSDELTKLNAKPGVGSSQISSKESSNVSSTAPRVRSNVKAPTAPPRVASHLHYFSDELTRLNAKPGVGSSQISMKERPKARSNVKVTTTSRVPFHHHFFSDEGTRLKAESKDASSSNSHRPKGVPLQEHLASESYVSPQSKVSHRVSSDRYNIDADDKDE